MAKEQRRYTDAERATLVAMLMAEGYPNSRGALRKVSDYAQVAPNVLRRWFNRTQNPPDATLVTEKRLSLAQHLEVVAHTILGVVPDKLSEAELSELTSSLATLVDKIQLLTGQPTEHLQHDIHGLPTVEDRADRAMGIFNAARARRDRRPAVGTDD